MQLQKVIKTRRSIRKFTTKNVESKAIETILESAIFAPSSGNSRPFKFYILRDRKFIDLFYGLAVKSIIEWREENKKLEEYYTDRDLFLKLEAFFQPIKRAPVHILLFFDLQKSADLNTNGSITKFKQNHLLYNSYRDSLHYAIQNMYLTATDLGLGTVYLEITRHMGDSVNKILGIDSNLEYFTVLPIGYPDEEKKLEQRSIREYIINE